MVRRSALETTFSSSEIGSLTAGGVVLGVRREDECHVEVEPHRVAFDLDVALLHDVEESDLDLAREIGQLVDGEHPAIGPRQQAEVHRQLVREQVPAARRLDRVHVPDDVGDRHVRRGELLHVARVARQPRNRRVVAPLGEQLAAELRNGVERVVVHLAPRQDGDLLVEQQHEVPQDAALGLPAEPEQDEVVPRQDGGHELGDDGVLVAHDPRKQRGPVLEQADEVVAHLVLHGPAQARGTRPFRLFQLAQGGRLGHRSRLTG